jgi:hypothetical protein
VQVTTIYSLLFVGLFLLISLIPVTFDQGKRNLVDGFIRWCQRGKVGLNQNVNVKDVVEEDPTGLYDDFYVKTH